MKSRIRSARCWSCLVIASPTIQNRCSDVKKGGRIRRMPVESSLIIDYATRTVWALLVVVGALLLARAVRRATMRMLARSRAQANVTILLGNLAQVLVIVVGI